jgi:L-aminopeptidase/D-esterase-like protein
VKTMVRPGARNLITDVAGLRVGQAVDAGLRSGVTVVLPDAAARTVVDIRGGAPGTRETDALDPANLGVKADAIVVSGGSAFGLDAASGVMAWLNGEGRGFELRPGTPRIPIVPAAVIFDFAGEAKFAPEANPYARLGREAVAGAREDFALGNEGAGLGAIAGAYKGGTGSASAVIDEAICVGALVVVNAVGSPLIPGTDVFWAFPLEQKNEFGGRRVAGALPEIALDLPLDGKGRAGPGLNTTIAIVATDADLSGPELKRVAIMATDGLARALRPVHTPFDGDTLFALTTAKRRVGDDRLRELTRIGSLAADCVSRAVARAVYAAETLGNVKSYRDRFRS